MRSCQNAIKVCYNVEDLGDPRRAPPPVPRAVAGRASRADRRDTSGGGAPRKKVGNVLAGQPLFMTANFDLFTPSYTERLAAAAALRPRNRPTLKPS